MTTSKKLIISVKNVHKEFVTTSKPLTILNDVTFEVFAGEKIAIVGPSGSGKSTILSLLAGLDIPTSGSVVVNNIDIAKSPASEVTKYRNETISIIFQSFELIMPFTVEENIRVPLDIRKEDKSLINTVLQTSLESTRLTHRAQAYPSTLSGGEKQRVAIARALAANTPIILADEPTGSLDQITGRAVLELLITEVDTRGKTLIIITHDLSIAAQMDRVLEVRDGKVYEQKK